MIRDHYPSRNGSHTSIQRRLDPVVYGKATRERGPLTGQELREFEENGFLFFPGFFSPEEIQPFLAELKWMMHSAEIRKTPECVLEPSRQEVRSIFYIHKSSKVFQKLANHPRLVDRVHQILDSEVYIHQSRINLKPGFVGKEFYWHSDFETWHVEDGMPNMRAVSCSLFLTENNPLNGPTMVIPGSHEFFVPCSGETPASHYKNSLRKQEYGVPHPSIIDKLSKNNGVLAPAGPPGSVLLFDCNILHGSNGNITPWPRQNIFMVYNSLENRLVEPFCGLEPRPEFIASRKFEPIPSFN